MFNNSDLVKNSFFGYGLIIESDANTSNVYFEEGLKIIANTHLEKIADYFQYKIIKNKYDKYVNNLELNKKLEEENKQKKLILEKEKQKKAEEKIQRKLAIELEKLKKSEWKRLKEEKKNQILTIEYEKNKPYMIYDTALNNLKEFMYEDIYTLEKFKYYLKKNSIPNNDDNIINYSLYFLNYRLKAKNVILKNNWKSIEEFFEYEVTKYDKYFYNNKYNIEIYDDIIKRLEKKLVLFEAAPGVFITRKLMKKLGINTYTLNKFYNVILEIGKNFEFFSVKMIIDIMKDDKIIEFASEEKQIEKIVLSTPKIKSLLCDDNKYVFSFTENRFTRSYLVEELLKNIGSIDIYDLMEKIREDFNVELTIDSLVYSVVNSKLYYSEEMDKIYINKNIFLKEIFNE